MTKPQLDTLFRPRSVVIVGASTNPDRLTGRPLQILKQHGFAGDVAVVHPRESSIDGTAAYLSLSEVPFVPDVVLVMLRAELVPGLARECAAKGVQHMVVLSSGFEEADGGAALAEELRTISLEAGLGIVGPNSEGLWFVPGSTILTFGSAARRPSLHGGPVAVLSQSGSIGASVMRQLNDSGLGADVFVSVGNETVLGVADYLSWVVAHTEVTTVLCFLEGLKDGRAFLDAASTARVAGVAVVVLKGGSSVEGRLASASHTGKISSPSVVYESLLSQAGVTQVDTIEQLASAAYVLTGENLREAHGPDAGLTVIGLSGGSRSLIADAAEERGIPLATLEDGTSAELATFIPDFGVTTNPVDPTGQVLSDPALFPRTIEALAADPHTRALLVQYANGGVGLIERHLPALRRAVTEHRVPVIVSCLLDQLAGDHPVRRELVGAGIAYTHDPAAAVQLASLLFDQDPSQRFDAMQPVADGDDPASVVDWAGAVGFLEGTGVRPPHECVVRADVSRAELERALTDARLPFPVVVKPSPDEVEHKSELGLVILDVEDVDAVLHALGQMRDVLGPECRVLVQEMVPPGLELLAVLRIDPDFGPVMGLVAGGFFVELLGEISYVALPATADQIGAALDATRVGRMLAGYRGGAAVDRGELVSRLVSLGEAYARLKAPPVVLELNPLVVGADGVPVAIDALVEVTSRPAIEHT